MRFTLIFFVLMLNAFTVVFSQNVMTPLDSIVAYNAAAASGSSNNPNIPASGVIAKWVYDPTLKNRIPWDQSRFKCYYFNGVSFRLRFPKNYDPSGSTSYPLVLFMHGAGEAAPWIGGVCNWPNRENQDQLFWGAQIFDTRIENDEWNGFLLFPQQNCNQASGWDNNLFDPINQILDTLEMYNKFDPNRLIVMGLSSGGGGNIAYASRFPKRVAAIASSDPAFGFTDVNSILHIPIWICNGGQDGNPSPWQATGFISNVRNLGGDTYENYYATGGHWSWNKMWSQTDVAGKFILNSYWNRAHKAQPIVFFGNTQFCFGSPISVKMGITPGYKAYEWQKNTIGTYVTINNATSNEYTANEIGKYRVRFQAMPGSNWSDWSPSPITISYKPCATDTVFAERFEHYNSTPGYLYFGPSWGYKNYNFFRQSGLFVPGSETFTQDATGVQGRRFLFNHTYPHIASGGIEQTTPYAAGDIVWRYYDGIPVTPNTNYIFSFYAGNITTATPWVQLVPKINGVTLTPTNLTPSGTGNASWTKYNYVWNSGTNTVAYPEILNNSIINTAVDGAANGNDFALDEISLTKLLSPGGVANNMVLWAKSESLGGTVENGIGIWPNVSGKINLVQSTQASKPMLRNTAADNINFNPVAAFAASGVDFMTASNGFSGTTAHNTAHVFVVARSSNTTQTHFFLRESQSLSTTALEISLPKSGKVAWTAGNTTTNLVQTNFISSDVNQPLLWSFSKSNAGTASGFKQDIRKNGVVMASKNSNGNFTGNKSALQLGEFDGQLAEIIYYLDGTITAADQGKIESYLAIKYGLTLGNAANVRNYIASDGTIVWTGNAAYQNDVFGIGVDQASGLKQLISNSMTTGDGNGNGQFKKANIVLSADTIPADKSFLLAGHTTDSLIEQSIDLPASNSGAIRMAREWKVAHTGTVGPVTVSFDTTGLTLSGGTLLNNFRLMIDEDGDGDFNTGIITTVPASTAGAKKINFKGVNLTNNAVFTFITQAPTNGFIVSPVENIVTGKAATEQETVRLLKIKLNSNPVKGNILLLQVSSPETTTAVLQIINTNGATIEQRAININGSSCVMPVTTNSLADGVYLLRLHINGKTISERFVKTK